MQAFDSLAARAIPWLPRALVRRISRRYIAGDALADASARVRQLNAEGFSATLDVLGETVATWTQAHTMARAYADALSAIQAQGLRAGISIKPSALGLLLDAGRCEQLMDSLLQHASRGGIPVCMDMEDLRCTQLEIDLHARLQARHRSLGLALQAYLERTHEDIETLARRGSPLRICKGIYPEDPDCLVPHAAQDRAAINPHFLNHVADALDAGCFVSVATHDDALAEEVVALIHQRCVAPARFEFQMLLGVCEPLRDRLRNAGHPVCIYVPYGDDWYGYSTRRLKENPRIARYVMRAAFGM